jgi:hypothetical protein
MGDILVNDKRPKSEHHDQNGYRENGLWAHTASLVLEGDESAD